jgi:hypothetical protein
VKAFTLKETNPSTRILERLGFAVVGVSMDDDAGEVWEWRACRDRSLPTQRYPTAPER